jgi:hypothetical protein
MFINISSKRFWKVLGWILVALLINLLMILPLQTTLLSLDFGGVIFAQTGPPADTPTPIPTATPTHTSTSTSTPTATPPHTPTPIPTATPVQPPSPGGGGGSDDGGDRSGEADFVATATFTPLPFPTDPPVVTQTVVIFTPTPIVEATASVEPTTAEETPTPLPPVTYSASACELISAENPPPGFPTLAGNGVISCVPAGPSGTVVQVTTKMGRGAFNFTLAVPVSSDQSKIVEIDQDPNFILNPPASIPESIKLLVPFNIDLYSVDNNHMITKLTSHAPPLAFNTSPLNVSSEDTVVLLRYDEVEQKFKLPQQEYNPSTKVLKGFLTQTSFFVLGTLVDQPTSPLPGSDQVVPTLPPARQGPVTTPEASKDLSPLWLFLAMLAGLIGVITMFLLLGGGRALMGMLPGASPVTFAERDQETGGLALAFASQTSDPDSSIQVKLASLPATTSTQIALSQPQSSTRLNLPSIQVNASITAAKPGLLQVHQAVVTSDEVSLVGWNEAGLTPQNLAYTVLAGQLNWYGPDEIFARLHGLTRGDVIEVHSQTNTEQYVVGEIQSYQADTGSMVEIPQTTAEVQLVLIAWGEAYDIEQQQYRDYLVIQAYVSGDSSIGQPLGNSQSRDTDYEDRLIPDKSSSSEKDSWLERYKRQAR